MTTNNESSASARYNVAIVGQTGVGKSSLINYIYGNDIAETGVGKPVTHQGFHTYNFELNGLPVSLFDSWGLEVGKHDEWLRQLDDELRGRNVEMPAKDWFHSVFYCIGASNSRVQDCDIEVIKRFIQNKYQVCVILTKADLLSEEDEKSLISAIQTSVKVDVIPTCNVSKNTRSGASKQFGKDAIEKRAFIDFFRSLVGRLPAHCESVLKLYVRREMNYLRSSVDDGIGFIGEKEDELRDKLERKCTEIHNSITEIAHKEFSETVNLYDKFLEGLNYPPVTSVQPPVRTFGLKKREEDSLAIKLTAYALLPFVFIPASIYQFTLGRSSDVEKIKRQLDGCEAQMNVSIDKAVEDVVVSLNAAKRKAESLVEG